MTNLFLVPAGDPRARENFERTIQQRIAVEDLERLGATTAKLARLARGGVRAWGTKPGEDDRHVSTWSRMERGDWVLFYFDGLFPVSARVLARAHSPAVARRFWGEEEGETWEYLYLLDQVRRVDISRLSLNEALSYKPGSYPQGFARVRRDLGEEFGSVEQLLEQLSGKGHQLRLAIEAARAGEEMEAASLLDRFGELSDEQLRKEVEAYSSSEAPKSVRRVVEQLQRNRKLVEKLKRLYKGQCQYCSFTFKQRSGRPYCEAAHLKPMARREANIDVKDNLFILCPNHHKMLDYGSLRIEWDPSGVLVGVVAGKATPMTNKHVAAPSGES